MSAAAVTVTRDQLDRCARYIDAAVTGMNYAEHLREEGQAFQAGEAQEAANESAQRALALLMSLGARLHDLPPAEPTPLHLLDTPKSRQFVALMRVANEAAEEVDRERGHVLPNGEPIGWSDAVGDVYHRLRQEVEGPKGGGRE